MTTSTLILLATGILGSSLLTAFVVGWFGRNKNNAETEQIAANVYRSLNQDLLKQLKDAKEQYEREIEETKKEYELRLADKEKIFEENLATIKKQYETKIKEITNDFEERIKSLEADLAKYKKVDEIIDVATTAGHEKLNELSETLKNNIKQ